MDSWCRMPEISRTFWMGPSSALCTVSAARKTKNMVRTWATSIFCCRHSHKGSELWYICPWREYSNPGISMFRVSERFLHEFFALRNMHSTSIVQLHLVLSTSAPSAASWSRSATAVEKIGRFGQICDRKRVVLDLRVFDVNPRRERCPPTDPRASDLTVSKQ